MPARFARFLEMFHEELAREIQFITRQIQCDDVVFIGEQGVQLLPAGVIIDHSFGNQRLALRPRL